MKHDPAKLSVWTSFWDMHSGGSQKEPYHHIFIEAPERVARAYFIGHFGHDPDHVTCNCCGPDYSVDSDNDKPRSLLETTGFHRNCQRIHILDDGTEIEEELGMNNWHEIKDRIVESRYAERQRTRYSWGDYLTIEEYIHGDHEALVLWADDISSGPLVTIEDKLPTHCPTCGAVLKMEFRVSGTVAVCQYCSSVVNSRPELYTIPGLWAPA